MVFSSATFLLAFLPLFLIVYFVIPWRPAKNVLLLLASLLFYAWGEPVYIWLMVFSMTVNWAGGVALSSPRCTGVLTRKLVLAITLIIDLGILGFFKYEGFVAENVNALIGTNLIPDYELPLPIGISFYTLQAVSYVVDVYRRDTCAQKNPLYLGMYIAMFPQLVAGPIVRYSDIENQIDDRHVTLAGFCSGIRLFCIGLGKKVLLANTVAILATDMLSSGGASIGAIGAWAGLAAYSFQIFFDFGGYSDMAIGMGKMMGFNYPRNFNYPYISHSATEFWRRWHMTLGGFFRDYVYIPLGGNRASQGRWVFNIAVVWGLTGIWHGAAWNFLLWGLYYGVLLICEKLFLLNALDRLPSAVRRLWCIAVFMFGWLIFWIEDPAVFAEYTAAMFGAFGLTGSSSLWMLGAWEYWPLLIPCVLAATPLVPQLRENLVAWACHRPAANVVQSGLAAQKCKMSDLQCDNETWLGEVADACPPKHRLFTVRTVFTLADLACLVMLCLSIVSVISGSFNPFIYFRF